MMLLILCALACWFMVFVFLNYWSRPPRSIDAYIQKSHRLAIVIAARNEQENIERLLRSIENQTWLPKNTVVYVVDDHSKDNTASVVLSLTDEFSKFKLILSSFKEVVGKKSALRELLTSIDADVYYFTDADCELSAQTIPVMLSALENETVDAAFCSVVYKGKGFVFDLLQAEQLNSQVVTEAFFNFGKPIMANAASMMIRQSAKNLLLRTYESEVASGDDTFFAQSLNPAACRYVMQPDTVVYTCMPESVREFANQRIRWASKSVGYPSIVAKAFAALILLFNLVWVVLMTWLMVKGWWTWVLVFIVSKFGIEYPFHRKWFLRFNYSHKVIVAMLLSILHPIYVCVIGVLSFLGVGYTWKGRTFKR
ncbi:MAG: glycosyltransferase [Flavobacteriales bacterium]